VTPDETALIPELLDNDVPPTFGAVIETAHVSTAPFGAVIEIP
jgi:segregation and condensation protein B